MVKENRKIILKTIKQIQRDRIIKYIWQQGGFITIYATDESKSVLVVRISILLNGKLKIDRILITQTDYDNIGDVIYEIF